MVDHLIVPELTENKPKSARASFKVNSDLTGKITGVIGTGQNAKDSFIWMTITWSFYTAGGISVLMFLRLFFGVSSGEDILDSIIKIWSVFVPIITLSLGYAFGKGK